MRVIPTIHFCGQCKNAIKLYQQAFDCKIQSIMFYKDAVEHGWEPDDPQKRENVYHSEILFGDQLIRMSDGASDQHKPDTTIFFAMMMDTPEQAKQAFDVISQSGSIVEPLKSTPFSTYMGSAIDEYGIRWRIMCD